MTVVNHKLKMALTKKIEATKPSVDGHDAQADIFLLERVFDTASNKMAEMTNIPLDAVQTFSMMSMYADEFLLLSEDMKVAQRRYTEHYLRYHPNAVDRDIVDVYTDPDFDTEKLTLLMVEWLIYFYQLRRSINGDQLKNAVTLTQDQMAIQQSKEEQPDWTKALNQ